MPILEYLLTLKKMQYLSGHEYKSKIVVPSIGLIYGLMTFEDKYKENIEDIFIDDNSRYFIEDNQKNNIINNKNNIIDSKIDNNIIYNKINNSIKPTCDKSIISKNIQEEFLCNKKNQKLNLGRKRKNDFSFIPRLHTKYKQDNIVIKIKRYFFKSLLKFINLLIQNSENENIKKLNLKKIDYSKISSIKISENINLLKLYVKDVFSFDICKKYTNYDKSYNKKSIDFIMMQNDENLKLVLNMTVKDMLGIYCEDDIKDDIFKDFKRLKDEINNMRENDENEDYIANYEYQARNFEKIYMKKKPRNKLKLVKIFFK